MFGPKTEPILYLTVKMALNTHYTVYHVIALLLPELAFSCTKKKEKEYRHLGAMRNYETCSKKQKIRNRNMYAW